MPEPRTNSDLLPGLILERERLMADLGELRMAFAARVRKLRLDVDPHSGTSYASQKDSLRERIEKLDVEIRRCASYPLQLLLPGAS